MNNSSKYAGTKGAHAWHTRRSGLSLMGALSLALTVSSHHGFAQQTITSGTYTQNFDSIGSGLPLGWSTRTAATTSSIGTAATLNAAATAWSTSTGQFANYASNNIDSSSSTATQTADTNRALGMRQTGSVGDPGASFSFNFSSIDVDLSSISFDLMTLYDNTRTTTWTIDYGIGPSPTSFTTLGTYSSGTFASTNFTFTLASNPTDLASMSNAGSVWIRVSALVASTGTGSRDTTAIDNFSVVAAGTEGGDLYWDGGTWSSSSPSTGGSGTWANGSGSWESANTAHFGGTAGTVNINGVVNADSGLNFETDGYVVTGGTLTLGASSITTGTGVTATISSVISGSAGLSKLGDGTLQLTGSNDFTGTVLVSGGTLSIDSDSELGNADNDISMSGGTLAVAGDVDLGSGRDISGAGTFAVSAGHTLQLDGNVNAAFTLSDAGTVYVTSIGTITGVTFSAPGTLNAAGSFLTGNVTTTQASGTAHLSGLYDFGDTTHTFTVADGSANTDLDLDATLYSTGSARIAKLGAGTLRISGDLSGYAGGLRIGTSGTTGVTGGRVIVSNASDLGAAQLQFNYGTLEAESDIDAAIGISFGSLEGHVATFSGANMTFTGSSSLYETTGAQSRFDVNNKTTLNGVFLQNSGSTYVASGLTIGGSGTLVLNADSSGMTRATTLTDTVTVAINEKFGAAVTVNSGATLSGSGTIAGAVTVKGTHAVGDTVGIQTAQNGVSYLSGAKFQWALVNNSDSSPGTDFSKLVVSGGNVSIAGGTTLNLVFNDATSTVDWGDAFWDTDHTWTLVELQAGTLSGIFGLSSPSTWFDANGDLLSSIRSDASFEVAGVGNNVVLSYAAVPEPSVCAMGLVGLGLIGWVAIRRRARVA